MCVRSYFIDNVNLIEHSLFLVRAGWLVVCALFYVVTCLTNGGIDLNMNIVTLCPKTCPSDSSLAVNV
jgi:hypothetical protein